MSRLRRETDIDGDPLRRLHVIPVDDLIEHQTATGCVCRPVEVDGIWVHHAADGREHFEHEGPGAPEVAH